jgi:hypothetical protein
VWFWGWGRVVWAFRDFSSLRTHFRAAYCNRRRVDTRFRLLKYCSRTEPSVENCGSPTLRFGEVLDFSLSFCLRHPAAWPAALQITFKNNAECSLFELLRDVFSKSFQSSMPFVPLYGMRLLYVVMAHVKQQILQRRFLAYKIIAFSLP